MFIDQVKLTVKAGNGGNGASTFLRSAQTAKGGPDGGNGGNGGDVYVQGSHNVADLRQFRFKKKVIAANGESGKRKNLFGKNANDITIFLPFGTIITDLDTQKKLEIYNENPIRIAVGGKGGRGNYEFRTATDQAPTYAEPGEKGTERSLHLELKLIADIGLIGLPNAGKSSFLSVVTNATPKIGSYPFTTLEPNIGVFENFTLADIPGLIEGASKGKGLGTRFLKHIEKTQFLLHCLDVNLENPLEAYTVVRKEFEEYGKDLIKKEEVIVLTKIDLATPERIGEVVELFEHKGYTVWKFSFYDEKSIENIKELLRNFMKKMSTL